MYKHSLTPPCKIASKRILLALITGIICLSVPQVNALEMQTNELNTTDEAGKLPNMISTDFNLPVTLDSKNQQTDGKKKTLIFTENVVIRQGSLEILADKVEADASRGKGKEVIIANGSPASYKQRLDDGSMVEAKANEIIYTVDSRTISLKGQASIIQNEVQVTGDSIVFDMSKEQILASTNPESSGTVTTVLSPGAFSNKDSEEDPEK